MLDNFFSTIGCGILFLIALVGIVVIIGVKIFLGNRYFFSLSADSAFLVLAMQNDC